jgi:flagellar biosynthesis protein FlhF
MEIKTYRAATMHDALAMVRRELGPDASVLHTREVSAGWLRSLLGAGPQIEVTASVEVNVPSRLPRRLPSSQASGLPLSAGESFAPVLSPPTMPAPPSPPSARPGSAAPGAGLGDEVKGQLTDLQAMLHELCRRSREDRKHDLPEALFRLFTDLIDADLSEELARELVERVRAETPNTELDDPMLVKARLARMLEAEIAIAGPISITPGRRRLVALVGPTGVGKTTTIAKLAAIYRLKQKRNVGLITVDTYRIAAVEQLRTYADIIDLPMQVVSTPREMREAVRRMAALDLILLDTAGRSPKDGIRLQELKAFLNEAAADEVHLVLSSVASAQALRHMAERFAVVGTTALILTKLDEATSLGNVLPLLHASRLPLSYLTHGQNVPDDIQIADPGRLVRPILGLDTTTDY